MGFFGTPAGGAGLHGCLEMGASVVALCSDDHHKKNLNLCMLQRAVESMVSATSVVFKEESLRLRSIQLNLLKDETAKGDDADGEPPKETQKDKKEKKDKREKKDKKQKDHKKDKKDKKDKKNKKDTKEEDSSSSSRSSASNDSSSPPPKKKAKS